MPKETSLSIENPPEAHEKFVIIGDVVVSEKELKRHGRPDRDSNGELGDN